MAALERRTSSSSSPWPVGAAGATITVKTRGDQVITSATSLKPAGVVHTQLESSTDKISNSRILVRLNSIDTTATFDPIEAQKALWSALFPYFATGQDAPETINAELVLPSDVLHDALIRIGSIKTEESYSVSRSAVFQLFNFSQQSWQAAPFPHVGSAQHPHRPPKPAAGSQLYTRFIPHLNQLFKLEPCSQKHLEILHNWMNDERVDKFWEEKGTIEQHKKFIEDRVADPHTLAVIGSYLPNSGDKAPATEPQLATYSEIYWVKEDRLGSLMKDVRDYDRGIHVLVGSNQHRGPHRVRAWLPSLVHYCFLDDPRTERVVAEPNSQNAKMIQYFESVGFKRHGDVTFPHKVAALMILEKADFYKLCPF